MITAWSFPCVVRARASAGPLLRVLGLAVLLFGVVFTHGVHVEGVKGHMVTSAAAPAAAAFEDAHDDSDRQVPSRTVATDDRHDDHGSPHPSEHCVSGQPHQGPVLAPPCFAASISEPTTPERATANWGLSEPERTVSSSAALRSSVVQQV
ncbi:hypothetical protein [Streptomyces werraensis]|uniref:hypothetical protein n=1 Tax=Streptomyces werraensis TaxID=68284 RepID=UPI0033AE9D68